jgi:cytoplasmic iron level regulating protein YaaA (DUF328/UPF0246 family)
VLGRCNDRHWGQKRAQRFGTAVGVYSQLVVGTRPHQNSAVKILLPPSETKSTGSQPTPLHLDALVFPELASERLKVMTALIRLSKRSAAARDALGISLKLDGERLRNLELLTAPTGAALEVYTGVLFDALDFRTLPTAGKARAHDSVLIQSALFGWVAAMDQIPAYRLSGNTKLPSLGIVSTWWAQRLVSTVAESELVLDLRSGTYEKFWQPNNLENHVLIKVMQRDAKTGSKIAVSHFNKATKGRIARTLLTSSKKFTAISHVTSLLEKNYEIEVIQRPQHAGFIVEVFVEEL